MSKNNLNLPFTTMPIKADLPKNESYESWNNVYFRMRRDGKNPFILHDGPPYANGDIHIGHALNKILKDFVVKFNYFKGRAIEFVPGWDCHGLPIEQKVKQLYPKIADTEIRQKCREYAEEQINNQKKQFQSLGIIADWDNSYKTMDPEFEITIYSKLIELNKTGFLSQRNKPVYWSWAEQTALAEAEIEYKEKKDNSLYVVFPSGETGFLVWTTTPWTLPANVAIALNPDINYVSVKVKNCDRYLFVAENLFNTLVEKEIAFEKKDVFKGNYFDSWKVKHPIYDKEVPVVMADFVSDKTGTGCVHIAPGHGEDDYQVGRKYNLPVVMPVGPGGFYTEGKYAGYHVFDGNKIILEDLKKDNLVVHEEICVHSYPYCWRSNTPVICRATKQFFFNLDKIRNSTLEEIEKIDFIPETSKNRLKPMIQNRNDWCVSRQRVWGVPIAFYRNKLTGELLGSSIIYETLKSKGIDAWCTESFPFSENSEKVTDILDVWFDSGLTWNILNGRQADLYLEGNDQHRGWFQSSLWLGMALTGKSPYKKVITHGFIVDSKGEKMSKQKGNVVNPNTVVSKFGAEVLRYWVASSDYTKDTAVSDEIIKSAADGHKKLRNTLRFLLANLIIEPKITSLEWVDKWILDKANSAFNEIYNYFENYEYHKGMHKLTEFFNGDLNSIYFNTCKDRLYCDKVTETCRNSCVYAMSVILEGALGLIAPLFTYTANEVFSHSPSWFKKNRQDIFDFLYKPIREISKCDFSEFEEEAYWKEALKAFHLSFDKLKMSGKAKDSLEVVLESSRAVSLNKIADWFQVSSFNPISKEESLSEFSVQGEAYRIVLSKYPKCERCWKRNGSPCSRCKMII